jgi:hypothetical protein
LGVTSKSALHHSSMNHRTFPLNEWCEALRLSYQSRFMACRMTSMVRIISA